jgi:hypothetical protein
MGRNMGQGARSHSISILLLLIAVGVRGITPDGREITSLRAAHFLCLLLDPSDCLEDEEDLEEAGSPTIPHGLSSIRRLRLDSRANPWSESTGSTVPMTKVDALQRSCSRGDGVHIDHLICLLCRFTC